MGGLMTGPLDLRALNAANLTESLTFPQIKRWFTPQQTEATKANNWVVWVQVCNDCAAVVWETEIDLRKHVAFHLRLAFADPDVPNVPAYLTEVLRDPDDH